jgi:hypothetical protein
MAYEPTTEAGKAAIASGADASVVEEMEKKGELSDPADEKDDKNSEHIDSKDQKQGDKDPADDQGGKKGDDDSADGDDEGPNRDPKHMPMWKHKEELKKQEEALKAQHEQDLQAALAEAASKDGGASDEDVKKLATDFNLEPDVASAMVDRLAAIVEKRAGLPEIRKSLEAGSEAARQQQEEQGFAKEWSENDTQAALKSVAGNHEITSDVQRKVKELAYSTTYARYRIADIIKLNASTLFTAPPKESRSAEQGRGGAGRGQAQRNIDEMTPDEINGLSDDEFMKLSNELGGKSSRFTRITKPK